MAPGVLDRFEIHILFARVELLRQGNTQTNIPLRIPSETHIGSHRESQMTTMRKLVFGEPPFRFLAQHLAQDEDFLGDARVVLDLEEDAYQRLATQLATTESFLSRADLVQLVANAIGDTSDRIAAIIYRFGGIIHGSDMDAAEALNTLREAIEEKTEGLDPQERAKLIERIQKLVVEPVGIAKQYKARQLVGAIGAELDDFRIICDIRPIFDGKRERIDGAIPLTIVRLEFTEADGDSNVVELRVTEKQINKLEEKIADAKLKLKMIKELMANRGIVIPKTKSTSSEET